MTPIPYAPDVECIPPDEAADTAAVLELIHQALQSKEQSTGKRQRDVHAKANGCARAYFQVINGLPQELRQGLFATPESYPAFVRFSNSSPVPLPDSFPDARGMAIQVEGVIGEFLPAVRAVSPTQDFVLVNHPTFISRNVKDYQKLQASRLEAARHPARGMVGLLTGGSWNPVDWKWREALSIAQVAVQWATHPAAYTYYSMAPFRFGEYVAKYRVIPRHIDRSCVLGPFSLSRFRTDHLRSALTSSLRQHELTFEFQVQLRTNVQTMPVEDPTVQWPERDSPFQTVATLTLPQQEIGSLSDEGEARAFSVWNALSAHRPLGGINRVRREAYSLSASWRRRKE